MPAAHPLAARHSLGGQDAARVERQLRALLQRHGGDVHAAAAQIDPPVHPVTLAGWLTAWGLRATIDLRPVGRPAAAEPAKKKDGAAKNRARSG